MANSVIKGPNIKTIDKTFSFIGPTSISDFTASAILGVQILSVADISHSSHIPIWYQYSSNRNNWNLRWFHRDTGVMITSNIEGSITLRIYYI